MDNLQIKDALIAFLDLIKTEIASFEKTLSQQEKRLNGSLENWSAKDVLSHLVFWDNHFISQVSKARSGEKVPQVDDYLDQINDGIFIEHFDQSFSDAFNDLEKSCINATNLLQSFSADELNDKGLYDFLNGRTLVDNSLGTFGWHITHHISDYYLKNGFPEKAVGVQEIYSHELQKFPSWEANAIYNLACFFAQVKEKDKAINNLKAAFLLKPDLVEWSKGDNDLDSLRDDPGFKALFMVD
ncbi:MAG: ClbS/DfsB family four-helix bundle protein [Pelolinea sp.]|nr:ClbS/DfsB family four-helix bundle protein [Pelolinea sp.]